MKKPEAGDSVQIVIPGRTFQSEVVRLSDQEHLHGEEPAIVVKVDGVENTFAHKSVNSTVFWQWPEETQEDTHDDKA